VSVHFPIFPGLYLYHTPCVASHYYFPEDLHTFPLKSRHFRHCS
jgi:hypothetical protein